MSDSPKKPKTVFNTKKTSIFSKEKIIATLLVGCTYFILLCTFAVFGKIIWNGAPVLAKFGTHFITRSPETLVVLEIDPKEGISVPEEVFSVLEIYNPDANFENPRSESRSTSVENIRIKEGVYPLIDGWVTELETQSPGLYIDWHERNKDVDVAVGVPNDTLLTFDSVKWNLFKDTIRDHMRVSRTELFSDKQLIHKITVPKATVNLNYGVIKALNPTDLIYIVQGIPTDDDSDSTIFPVVIPDQQTITVNDLLFKSISGDGEGKLPITSASEEETSTDRIRVTIAQGDYTIPFKSYFDLKNDNPALGFEIRQGSKAGVVMAEFDEDTELQLSGDLLAQFEKENPNFPIERLETLSLDQKFMVFDLSEPVDLSMPNKERVEFVKFNPEIKVASEKSFSYSGGGVKGPLIGTAILVIICITVALFVGVSAAVYLNEYSGKGGFLKTVRLAMLNLAGVPSIIFGLFGLMLFVILAPRITSTPSASDSFRIPIFPSLSQPSLRKLEGLQILKAEDGTAAKDAALKAKLQGKGKFYNGLIYISFEGWGTSILAGGLTLAIMVLPVIITACEESLRAVPMGFREASLALGASKWQSIRTAVLPYAFPGILTASVLGITRVAGETAPIMFTAAVAAKSGSAFDLPAEGGILNTIEGFFFQSVQALPYHIYTVAGRIPQSEFTEPMQYGATLLFLIVVMLFAGLSVWLRIRARKKLKW